MCVSTEEWLQQAFCELLNIDAWNLNSTCCFNNSAVCETNMYIHNNASAWRSFKITPCIKLEQSMDTFIDSTTSKKWLTSCQKWRTYTQLACRLWCNALWCQLAKMISQWVINTWTLTFLWWLQKQNVSSLLPISLFPHFPFLISHFLIPTFRVTRCYVRPSVDHVSILI